MKLFYSSTSPFVRKVLACATARGIAGQIQKLPSNPHESQANLTDANPLSKVPCLITEDGLALFDSRVICEYLDSVGDEHPMFPTHGAARWRALKLQAMGDGIMDAAVLSRGEMQKADDAGRKALLDRQKAAITRSLGQLELDPPHRALDIGSITIACALGYLDLRFAADPWRPSHPKLATWYEAVGAEPAIAETAPPPA